jgi:hypothetical protein
MLQWDLLELLMLRSSPENKKDWTMLDTRQDARIDRLQMNKQPIREKLERYLTADE